MNAVELIAVPELMQRYPTLGGALHGMINLSLGKWCIDGKAEEVILRVRCEELKGLVEKLQAKDGRALSFAFGALECFVSAGVWPILGERQE